MDKISFINFAIANNLWLQQRNDPYDDDESFLPLSILNKSHLLCVDPYSKLYILDLGYLDFVSIHYSDLGGSPDVLIEGMPWTEAGKQLKAIYDICEDMSSKAPSGAEYVELSNKKVDGTDLFQIDKRFDDISNCYLPLKAITVTWTGEPSEPVMTISPKILMCSFDDLAKYGAVYLIEEQYLAIKEERLAESKRIYEETRTELEKHKASGNPLYACNTGTSNMVIGKKP